MNSIDTFSYECTRYLATVLSPMVGKTQHHVKNSTDFAEEATKIKVEPAQRDEIICCLSRMDDTKFAMGTSQPQKTSSDCRSCAWNALFQFDGEWYPQVHGASMSSPASPIVCNMSMESFEQKALATAELPPNWWERYVDDTHTILKRENSQGPHTLHQQHWWTH